MLRMKALTVQQFWTQLIALGVKPDETRSWGTGYRGQLAIHSSKVFPGFARQLLLFDDEVRDALRRVGITPESLLSAPLGSVVAVCRLADCVQVDRAFSNVPSLPTRAFGDYSPGRWIWRLAEVRMLKEPVPWRGEQGLWDVTPALYERMLAQGVTA